MSQKYEAFWARITRKKKRISAQKEANEWDHNTVLARFQQEE